MLEGPIADPANGHQYLLLNAESWTASESEAVSLGGNLVTINDAGEQAWVSSTFAQDRNLWIGLYNPTQNSDPAAQSMAYVWIDGENSTYRNWSPSEPNNLTFEFWGMLWGDSSDIALYPPDVRPYGTWNNIAESGNYPGSVHQPFGVVEIVPEPSMMIPVAVAVLLIHLRRKTRLSC